MYSKYSGDIIFTVTGMAKRFLRKNKQITVYLCGVNLFPFTKAVKNEEEMKKLLHELATKTGRGWKEQLACNLIKKRGLVLTGVSYVSGNFCWTPQFMTFDEIKYDIQYEKLFDYADESAECSLQDLTPKQFKEEFGFEATNYIR